MLNLLKEYLNNDEKLARWAFLELGLTAAGARDRMLALIMSFLLRFPKVYTDLYLFVPVKVTIH